MKILIIAMNVGRTAPGIVFERLIYGLSKMHDVDVATAEYEPSINLSNVKNILEIKKKYVHPRINKLLISLFRVNPFDWLWAKNGLKTIRKAKGRYDLVFSFISFHNYAPLLLGYRCAKKAKKFAVYSVDAIPAPLGWSKDDSYFSNVKELVGKYLSKTDLFFSANEQMLRYQLTTFNPKNNSINDVIYNPSFGKFRVYEYNLSEKNTFLYTGGIYGARKPDYILKAFKMVIQDFPNSTLEFVGSYLPESCFEIFSQAEREKIIIHPFTNDLEEYYKNATALIDIDADLPDDVFLSSKIINYVTINRVIISETGINSPSRKIFKNIPSILQCDHDAIELANAMRQVIQNRGNVDFSDRHNVNSMFNLSNIVDKINSKIWC